jgi:hypothetical protein
LAGGDPVNFSDPFGLCPEPVTCTLALLSGTGALLSNSSALVGTTANVVAAGASSIAGAAIHSVYTSATEGISYIGRTNDVARRGSEHQNGPLKMKIKETIGGLTKDETRGVEQVLIEARGLKKNGGDLVNQINSISPSNPNYEPVTTKGREKLENAGMIPRPVQQ